MADLARRYEQAVGSQLPALLARVLSTWNGWSVDAGSRDESGPSGLFRQDIAVERQVEVRDVGNGLVSAADVAHDEIGSFGEIEGLRVATAYGQCPVILVDEGELRGSVVFDDAKGPRVVLADSLAAFLRDLAAIGMSVEAVVERASSVRI